MMIYDYGTPQKVLYSKSPESPKAY